MSSKNWFGPVKGYSLQEKFEAKKNMNEKFDIVNTTLPAGSLRVLRLLPPLKLVAMI
jgi:hypothetical protein